MIQQVIYQTKSTLHIPHTDYFLTVNNGGALIINSRIYTSKVLLYRIFWHILDKFEAVLLYVVYWQKKIDLISIYFEMFINICRNSCLTLSLLKVKIIKNIKLSVFEVKRHLMIPIHISDIVFKFWCMTFLDIII